MNSLGQSKIITVYYLVQMNISPGFKKPCIYSTVINGYGQGLEWPNDQMDWVEEYEINGVKDQMG